MKTLKDLTPEIRAEIEVWKKECVEDLYSGKEYREFKPENCVKYVEYVYNLAERPKPIVVIADTPEEYKRIFKVLWNPETLENTGKLVDRMHKDLNAGKEVDYTELNKLVASKPTEDIPTTSHYLFLLSAYARVYLMWYVFINRKFDVPTSKQKELDWLWENVKQSGIGRVYMCEQICLVLRLPSKIIRNEIGFHSVSEGAIQYPDRQYYYINGRSFPEEYVKAYQEKKLTLDMFNSEQNEDVRGGIITMIKEIEGEDGVMKFLNAEIIDTATLVHDKGYMETVRLAKTKDNYSWAQDSKGNTNVPLAWVNETCPSTGTSYFIPCCPTCQTAEEAIKSARPTRVPKNIPYFWNSAS